MESTKTWSQMVFGKADNYVLVTSLGRAFLRRMTRNSAIIELAGVAFVSNFLFLVANNTQSNRIVVGEASAAAVHEARHTQSLQSTTAGLETYLQACQLTFTNPHSIT